MPAVPYALEFFDALGSAVGVADEAQFRRLQCMTCVMGDIYERERTMLQWLVEHDVARAQRPLSFDRARVFRARALAFFSLLTTLRAALLL